MTAAQKRFARLARLGATALRVPIVTVGVVAQEGLVTAHVGMARALLARGSTLVPALCGQVVESGPQAVGDLAAHPLGARSPLVANGMLGAFAGAPVYTADPAPVGYFCALAEVPRPWTPGDLELLGDLAAAVGAELRAHEHDEALRRLVTETEAAA